MPAEVPPQNIQLEKIYNEHHHWLRTYLHRKLRNQSDAADLAQDTFVNILKARHGEIIQEPRAYLTTVAKRLVADFFKRRMLEEAYLVAISDLPEHKTPSPEAKTLIVETLLEIDNMLDGLGHKVKQAFILSQLDGLTYAEIAEQLNVSLRSVKNYMAKATAHCCLFQIQHEQDE